ncbi:MAG: zinc ribbon domain-containing protein [Chloroflexota bacterium]|nr:zinc ribbon domain-containing protein [Chloroflexota bacterium]
MKRATNSQENSPPARLECPGCGSSSFTAGPDDSLVCNYCHAAYVLPGYTCDECGTVYDPGARYCPSCGADLVRECPACGADNPPSTHRCQACGQELDMLEALFARATGTTADWLQQQRDAAPAIKAQEEAASQTRLAKMWAAEERRREELARAQTERDRQQKIIVTITIAIVALLVIAAIIVVAITTSGAPSPHFLF